jgi:hypothetical protein
MQFSVAQIVALNDHDIDPDFVRRLGEAGLADLSFEQIIELHERDVDPALLRALRSAPAR